MPIRTMMRLIVVISVLFLSATFISILHSSQNNNASAEILNVIVPQAAFSASVDGGIVTFTDESVGINIIGWRWTFGDGETSDERSPVHVYDHIGNYSVTMVITDSMGKVSQHTELIRVPTMQNAFIPAWLIIPILVAIISLIVVWLASVMG